MLRALASYFFGGIEDETPEAPIECETREVNDWLVVNLPDQNKVSINLNDEDADEDDDTYEIDDEDIRNGLDEEETVEVDTSDVIEMDSDEDDILLSVSFLMMPPDTEKLSPQLSNDQSIFEKRILEKPSYQCSYLPAIPRYLKISKEDPDNSPFFLSFKVIEALKRSMKRFQPQEIVIPLNTSGLTNALREDVLNCICPGRRDRMKRSDVVSEFVRKDRLYAKVFEVTSPPVSSKNYVNHRHPEKVLNYDLLQRIQELEPEQQAVQRSVRKNLTRGQLNRQNKNYMYETSSKKNRRCNRQRNHSGANNNRKC